MMYDDRYQRRQARAYRRASRGPLAGLAGGFFFIGLALAIVFGGHFFLFFLFAGLAFSALFGSASSMNPQGLYGGFQGFVWMLGLGVLFLIGFWPWILVLIGISAILGTLYIPLTAGLLGLGIFAATRGRQPQQPYQQPYQPYQQYQPDQPPSGEQPYSPYQQGYQPPPPTPGTYQEGDQQYPYPPQQQPKQEYEQPETQYPQQELPPQQQ